MIVFKGNLNPECREYMKKIKIIDWIVSVVGAFIATSWVVVLVALAVTKWLFLLLIPLLILIMADFIDKEGAILRTYKSMKIISRVKVIIRKNLRVSALTTFWKL